MVKAQPVQTAICLLVTTLALWLAPARAATPGEALAALTLQATRASGTAPLAVLFDATGGDASTIAAAFSGLTYEFDFGDERGERWAVSGQPKNRQVGGPIAAHVFEYPGRYEITVRATDGRGQSASRNMAITVDDAARTYAGANTLCVSASRTYADCPTGAAHATALPADTEWNGKRVLLHRGESFGDISIQDGNAKVQVGAYGNGDPPKVQSVGVGSLRPVTPHFATDISVMDLAVRNGVNQCLGSRVLFLRNRLVGEGAKNGLYFGAPGYWAQDDPNRRIPTAAFYNAREIFLVENTVIGSVKGDGYNAFGEGSRLALLGNVMGISKFHTLRLTAAHKTIVAHNELRGISETGTYHALKLHSEGLAPYADDFSISGRKWASDQVVVTDNLFGNAADNNQWTVAICPQNDAVAEGIENVLVRNNRFGRNSRTVLDLLMAGRGLVQKNNAVVDTGGRARVGQGHASALPPAWNQPLLGDPL